MTPKSRSLILATLCGLACAARIDAAETFDTGRATSGARIDAAAAEATADAAPTVVLLGGLAGEDATSTAVRDAVAAFEAGGTRGLRLLAVPVANPDAVPLAFPPAGVAYRENREAHVLWRWLGTQAPDLVLVAGADDQGLLAALAEHAPADIGRMPARRLAAGEDLGALATLPRSEAHAEIERRRARSPRQLAEQLAEHYGRDFDQPWYIGAVALVARLELGHLDEVRQLAEPWVDGTRDSLARPNALVMAGHIVFTELARRTNDERYTRLVRRVADLGFDEAGNMLEAMPFHGEYSDSVFMGTTIAAQAGALTGERRYFDMAARHLTFMQALVLRPDGLYRHQPATDAAWGRGNGFAALGLALTLAELPENHAGHTLALTSYRSLMAALLPLQNRDGLWRNVVDHPGAYPELSGTAMIGFALARGLRAGWLVDVCESTARMTSLEQYLERAAILGADPRGGAMAMLFATELMRRE